jgi:hypothetical protein
MVTPKASIFKDSFWAEGKKYAPKFWNDVRQSFDEKALDAARKWDAGSARDFWTWLALGDAAGYWTLSQMCSMAPYLVQVGPESWLGAILDVAGLAKGKITVKIAQGLARWVKGKRLLRGLRGAATFVEEQAPILSTPYGRLARQVLGKGRRALGQDWATTPGVVPQTEPLIPKTEPLPLTDFEVPPPVSLTRSRPGMLEPMKFKPVHVPHSPAFKKYGVPMPTGQTDPYPRIVTDMRSELRQDFLRDYYKANPLAANNARTEARRIIDLADKEFGYQFSPSRVDWNHIHQRQNQLRDFYKANPASAARARSEARTMIDWAHKTIR